MFQEHRIGGLLPQDHHPRHQALRTFPASEADPHAAGQGVNSSVAVTRIEYTSVLPLEIRPESSTASAGGEVTPR
jgi:hypothetical protein